MLVREGPLYGTGFFPGEREMIYEVERDELFLVGTSEVSLGRAPRRRDPRRRAAAAPLRRDLDLLPPRGGRRRASDTRGIFRVHQFDKVEMFSFVEPDESRAEHERILAIEERILAALEIPYRVVDIPVGDLGAPAARKFDCEAWIPSQERYRELTSTSNTTDYQARRLGARYREAAEAPPRAPPHAQRHRGRRRADPDRDASRTASRADGTGRAAAGADRRGAPGVDRPRARSCSFTPGA